MHDTEFPSSGEISTFETLGWSKFALDRHKPGTGFCYSLLSNDEILCLTTKAWPRCKPGMGRSDCSQVVVVPLPTESFIGTSALIHEDMPLESEVTRRQDGEDLFIKTVSSDIVPDKILYASAVLYSAATLLENDGERSTGCSWEIVALIASRVSNEPMHPLTAARNQLRKPGGTYVKYTSDEWAQMVWYWSQMVNVNSVVE